MRDPRIKSFIQLIKRSPDTGDGWRKVSPVIMRGLVESFPDQSLIEWIKDSGDAGRVRLTPKGKTVAPYL